MDAKNETAQPKSNQRAEIDEDVRMAALTAEMTVRRISVEPRQVVYVKGLIEACDGMAGVHALRGGELLLAAPADQAARLDALIADLAREMPLSLHAGTDGGWTAPTVASDPAEAPAT